MLAIAPRPREPITIMSASWESAYATISSTASPTRSCERASTPLSAAICSASSSEARNGSDHAVGGLGDDVERGSDVDEDHLRLVLGGELDSEVDGLARRGGAIGGDHDRFHLMAS
jgi:hypothetical protein